MNDREIVKKAIKEIGHCEPDPWIQHNTTAFLIAMEAVQLARKEEQESLQKKASESMDVFVPHDVNEALYKY